MLSTDFLWKNSGIFGSTTFFIRSSSRGKNLIRRPIPSCKKFQPVEGSRETTLQNAAEDNLTSPKLISETDWSKRALLSTFLSISVSQILSPPGGTIWNASLAEQVPQALGFAEIPNPSIPPVVPAGSEVLLTILDSGGLGVSIYPDFDYDSGNGGGIGEARDFDDERIFVRFAPEKLYIPPLAFDTTKFLGLPLPPPLRIEIQPEVLEGYIWRNSGKVELDFKANFVFSAGYLYKGAPLVVNTKLTTENAPVLLDTPPNQVLGGPSETPNDDFVYSRTGTGKRLDSLGRGVLVAVAKIEKVDDLFLDKFLMLPSDVIAVLPAEFIITTP